MSVSRVAPAQLRAARTAARVLAAVGPLPLDSLLAAVTRSRRFRTRTPLSATGLAAGLTDYCATTGPDGCWRTRRGPPSRTGTGPSGAGLRLYRRPGTPRTIGF